MIALIIIGVWLVSVPVAYCTARAYVRLAGDGWTRGDRSVVLVVSFLIPHGVLLFGLAGLLVQAAKDDREARW